MECRALGTGITSLSWPYINGRNPLLLNSRVATEERLRGYWIESESRPCCIRVCVWTAVNIYSYQAEKFSQDFRTSTPADCIQACVLKNKATDRIFKFASRFRVCRMSQQMKGLNEVDKNTILYHHRVACKKTCGCFRFLWCNKFQGSSERGSESACATPRPASGPYMFHCGGNAFTSQTHLRLYPVTAFWIS